MNCLLVHLSDLHIQPDGCDHWSETRGRLIARSAARSGPYKTVLLILSGDVAFGGGIKEYELAESFINSIAGELRQHTGCEVRVIVAPGNHDCDFTATSKLRAYARTQRNEETIHDPEMLDKLAQPLANFRRFESKIETVSYADKTLLHKSCVLPVGPIRIQLRVWTSPLYSEKREKKGELFLPSGMFDSGWDENAFRISVMHHPPAWFSEPDARTIRTAVRTHAHLALYGHEHYPEVGAITSFAGGRTSETIEVDGPVLHTHGEGESNFITYELDPESGALAAALHTWSGEVFTTSELTDLNRAGGWMQLPRKSKSLEVRDDFRERLEDPGMALVSRSGRRVSARDLYVAVDVAEKRSSASDIEEIFSSDVLADPRECLGGVVLQGEEKAGKTALLFWLFQGYQEAGLVPVYVALRDHKLKKPKDFAKIFAGAVREIYSNVTQDSFVALERTKKVFLVDDIDVLVKQDLRTGLIEYLRANCEYFVLTTTLRTQLAEVLIGDQAGAIGEIRSLRFQKFSYQKRGQLISQWLRHVEEIEDDEEFVRRLDHLEKSASVTLGHNLVPRVPQMLLIFLHSASASSPAKLESGALASYYNFLVTRQLLDAGVVPEELEEYVSFARIVSFFMHQEERAYVTLDELEVCNTKFAEEFYPGSMHARLNVLRSARLLTEFGDGAFQWRHSYLHYLFLGGFLGANGDNPEVTDAIKKMSSNLYVRANANALLFLVHFSKDRKVFGYLRQVIEGTFREAEPLRLGKDTKAFAEVIQQAQELTLPKSVLEERDQQRKVQDRALAKSDDHTPERVRTKPDQALQDIVVLFKTSEILGQVLKEQYASISRSLREPIVVALLNAYMRAAGGLLKEMALNRESLQTWVTKKLEAEQGSMTPAERMEFAQTLVSGVVQMFMFGFFQKLSESLSSDRTLDLIRHVPWEDSLEVKVFLLACELNLQRPLPLARIDALLMSADGDPAFMALIRNLVQVRISLFHTRASELQALAGRFKLDLSRLQAIDFRESRDR